MKRIPQEDDMGTSKASAHWEGSIKEGRGGMKPGHASEVAFSFGTRFEGQNGGNPEELVGAALAGCFSMALSAALGRAGLSPQSINTSASVVLDKVEGGFGITRIELETVAKVPGAEGAQFQTIAEETKKTCPVSKALAGTSISLRARLE
jgi:lipoyl-dependent peroxiredoxin